MKLNIGCGTEKLEGYENIDKRKEYEPDRVRDIEKGLPYSDNTVEEIYCSHVLEHIEDLVFVMNEFYRVLKEDGKLVVKVPPYDFEGAFSDPTHVRVFTPRTFKYFTKEREEWPWAYPQDIECEFEIKKFERQTPEKDPTAEEYYVEMIK